MNFENEGAIRRQERQRFVCSNLKYLFDENEIESIWQRLAMIEAKHFSKYQQNLSLSEILFALENARKTATNHA